MASSDSEAASQEGQRVAQGNEAAKTCSNRAAAARRGCARGSQSTANDVIEQPRNLLIIGTMAVQQPVGQLRIRLFEQAQECGAPAGISHCPAAIEPAAEQQVELPHATTATPPEETLGDVLHRGLNHRGWQARA